MIYRLFVKNRSDPFKTLTSPIIGCIIRTDVLIMENNNYSSLLIDTLMELAEEKQAHQTQPAPGLPTLTAALAGISNMPPEAAFLGLAADGLPVLLNLYDPISGPLLISGDQASGKTRLLQTIARAVELIHPATNVQYCVITQYPNEWEGFHGSQNNVGVYEAGNPSTQDLIHSLVGWARNNKGEEESVVLLIDDLEALSRLDQQTEQNLRWLFLRGPRFRAWPIATINAGRAQNIEAWLNFFRTRLFGFTNDPDVSSLLTGDPARVLNNLIAGSEFTLREGDQWVNFWVPALDD